MISWLFLWHWYWIWSDAGCNPAGFPCFPVSTHLHHNHILHNGSLMGVGCVGAGIRGQPAGLCRTHRTKMSISVLTIAARKVDLWHLWLLTRNKCAIWPQTSSELWFFIQHICWFKNYSEQHFSLHRNVTPRYGYKQSRGKWLPAWSSSRFNIPVWVCVHPSPQLTGL